MFLALAAALAAAPHTVNLSFDQLQLFGAALLGPGIIRTYDPSNGRVMLQVGQAARSVSIDQLPAALQQRLRLLVPSVPDRPAPTPTAVPVASKTGTNSAATNAAQDHPATDTTATPEPTEEGRPNVPDPRETARAAAKLFLSRNRFMPPADAAGSKLVSTYVLNEAVEPAPGRTDRYLVTGHYEMKVPGQMGSGSLVGMYPFTVIVQLNQSGRPSDISIEVH